MEPAPDANDQPSHTVHDHFFREAFGNLAAAADFLQSHLPPALTAAMDWSSLELVPASFIDQHLQAQSADLLYRVRCGGRACLIYCLLEHQTTVPAHMPLRLLGYMVRVWQEECGKPERARGQPLPVIIPLVLYQGPGTWKVSAQFLDGVDWPEGLRGVLEPLVPKFEHVLVDLGAVSLEEVRGKLAARVLLGLMKAARAGLAMEWFRQELPYLMEMMKQENLAGLVRTAARYWFCTTEIPPSTWQEEVLKLEAGQATRSFMSLAEQLILEGKREGLLEGKREGILQGRILALQEVLGLPASPLEELSAMELGQLQELLGRLQAQLRSRS